MLDLVGNPEDRFSRVAAQYSAVLNASDRNVFVGLFYAQDTNFSVILGQSHQFLGILNGY